MSACCVSVSMSVYLCVYLCMCVCVLVLAATVDRLGDSKDQVVEQLNIFRCLMLYLDLMFIRICLY